MKELSVSGYGITPSTGTSNLSKTVTYNGLAGETLIALIGTWASGRHVETANFATDGWTDVIGGELDSTVDSTGSINVFKRKLISDEASYTFSLITAGGATTLWGAAIIRIAGDVDPTTPIDVFASNLSQATGVSPICPDVTTTVPWALVLHMVNRFTNQNNPDANWPTGDTILFSQGAEASTSRNMIAAAYQIKQTAGAVGTATWTSLGTVSRVGLSVTVAIRPLALTTGIDPNTIAASTNLTGAITAIDEGVDSAAGDWLTATSATAATDVRVTFPTPP